jgi:hypothetical protein
MTATRVVIPLADAAFDREPNAFSPHLAYRSYCPLSVSAGTTAAARRAGM